MIAIDAAGLDEVIDVLRRHRCYPKKSPPVIQVGDNAFAQFLYTPPDEFYEVQFDLMLASTDFQKSAIARRVPGSIPGVTEPVDVVNCDDLIIFKLAAGRIIDRADAAMLLRENREEIDFAYLGRWVSELGLNAEYEECWREAFPGEPNPPAA